MLLSPRLSPRLLPKVYWLEFCACFGGNQHVSLPTVGAVRLRSNAAYGGAIGGGDIVRTESANLAQLEREFWVLCKQRAMGVRLDYIQLHLLVPGQVEVLLGLLTYAHRESMDTSILD